MMTLDVFAQKHGSDYVELVDGVVRPLPIRYLRHGQICVRVLTAIGKYVWEHDLGHVMSNNSFIITRRNPDSVRGPDVCFFSYERLPKGPVPDGLLPVSPELVVEVRSPSDTWTEVFTKVGEYLAAGVRVVLVLDDESKTASVYRGDAIQQMFQQNQQLIVPDVLPGFTIAVEKLFV